MRKENINSKTFAYFTPDIKIAGIGLGPFGLVNYKHLIDLGYSLKAFDKDENIIKHMQNTGRHPYHFKHVNLKEGFNPVSSIDEAVYDADLIILAVDSQNVRNAVKDISRDIKKEAVILNLAKGLEIKERNTTGKAKLLSEVETEVLKENNRIPPWDVTLAVALGGVFAVDLSVGANAYMTIASQNTDVANDLSKILRSDKYHTQVCEDMRGVELAGAIKNVIAIEKGIGDEIRRKYSTFLGIELKYLPFAQFLAKRNDRFKIEHSSLCGFISAYMNEMIELAVELGAKKETFSIGTYACGGDIMTTCFSNESRNVQFGRQIVRERGKRNGRTPGEIYEDMKKKRKTVEGYPATKAFYEIAQDIYKKKAQQGIKFERYALIDQSYKVQFEGKDPERGIECLARYASRI